MTMAESTDPMGQSQAGVQINNNHPFAANNNIPWKQRKRKRLSAVVDKLHNNNTVGVSNNNQGESSYKMKRSESRSSEEYPEEMCSDSLSPGIFNPLRLSEVDYNNLAINVKQENLPSPYDRYFPLTSPLFNYYLQSNYLDMFRRRSQSDAPVAPAPAVPPPPPPPQQQQQQPQQHHHHQQQQYSPFVSMPQDQPLDLSMKRTLNIKVHSPASLESMYVNKTMQNVVPYGSHGVPVVKGDVASPTTKESVASRYNLDVSPVVEEMPPGSDVAYVCPVCGQMFSLHDRLAKHMASRHKNRTGQSDIAKAYVCEVCQRSFARSDMLTRHMRLHTGVKPYTCKVCGQVFSRSDHLSTHQRTHTGEKPYKCPQCPYAACRRDMITRHMRTHTRYDAQRAAAAGGGVVDQKPVLLNAAQQQQLQQQAIIKKEEQQQQQDIKSSNNHHQNHNNHNNNHHHHQAANNHHQQQHLLNNSITKINNEPNTKTEFSYSPYMKTESHS